VQKFRKSFSIWQSQSQKQSGAFFWTQCCNTSKLALVQKQKMQNDQNNLNQYPYIRIVQMCVWYTYNVVEKCGKKLPLPVGEHCCLLEWSRRCCEWLVLVELSRLQRHFQHGLYRASGIAVYRVDTLMKFMYFC